MMMALEYFGGSWPFLGFETLAKFYLIPAKNLMMYWWERMAP